MCPEAPEVCENMSDPTGFGFVCMKVCSFSIKTEVHHSSRATAATNVPWLRGTSHTGLPGLSFHILEILQTSRQRDGYSEVIF